jgi:hypothetical protein
MNPRHRRKATDIQITSLPQVQLEKLDGPRSHESGSKIVYLGRVDRRSTSLDRRVLPVYVKKRPRRLDSEAAFG